MKWSQGEPDIKLVEKYDNQEFFESSACLVIHNEMTYIMYYCVYITHENNNKIKNSSWINLSGDSEFNSVDGWVYINDLKKLLGDPTKSNKPKSNKSDKS